VAAAFRPGVSPSARRLRLTAALAAAALALPLAAAKAETRSPRDRPAAKTAIKSQTGPILAVVSLARQRIWVYGSTGLVAQSLVSTGVAAHPTPTGVFSILQKNRFHRSNIYSAAPMPYMQRITWSGIALHAGVVPGYPASHGCIRLPQQFAVELWGMTRIGARVVVVPDDPAVSDIEHPLLPAPAMTPAALEASGAKDRAPGVVDAALADDAPPAPAKLLSPLERARAAKRHAIQDAAAKAKAAKSAVAASARKAGEANRIIGALRHAEMVLAAALAKRDTATKALQEAPEATERAKAALAEAERKLAEAETAAAELRAQEAVSTPEAITVAKAAWEAEQDSAKAAGALKATEHNTDPISIFVSKKAGRVFIRQAWAPVHEAAASFKEPDLAIGTHVYVARAAEDNGKTLHWLSVSLPPSRPAEARPGAKREAPAPQAAPAPIVANQALTATAALERLELEEETRAFIADRLWPGASLIISDEDMSRETAATTDFIVMTR
jgi:hypothetical protein